RIHVTRIDDQSPVQTMRLIIGPGCEVEAVFERSGFAVAEGQSPQAVDLDRVAAGICQLSLEYAGCRIERADPTIAEVSNEDVVAERCEVRRRLSHPPRGVKRLPGSESLHEGAIGFEDVDHAGAGAS